MKGEIETERQTNYAFYLSDSSNKHLETGPGVASQEQERSQ